MRDLGQRVFGGIKVTLPYAVFWSIFAAIVYSASPPADTTRHESLPSLIALYFSAAVSSGAVLGALRRWASTNAKFGVMSIAVALPFAFCLMLMANDWRIHNVDSLDWLIVSFLAVAFGPPFGFYLRSEAKKRQAMRSDA